MASLAIDPKQYGKLLSEAMPTVIESDEQHSDAVAKIKALLKVERRSPEQLCILKLLKSLTVSYEEKRWKRKREHTTPAEILAFLMEENGLKQSDLVDIAPQSNISGFLSGKRPISFSVAQKLARRFRVSTSIFLED